MWIRLRNVEGEKKIFALSSSLRIPDPFLLLGDPRLLINLPRNWLSHKNRCWSWNSSTLASRFEEVTYWKRPSCWERLKAGGDRDHRGWDGWMASPTQWIWGWAHSGGWWWTGRSGMLQSMGSQRVRHNWATELNWGLKKPWSSLPTATNSQLFCIWDRLPPSRPLLGHSHGAASLCWGPYKSSLHYITCGFFIKFSISGLLKQHN